MTDLGDWPALVLTAGLATRLRPLSDVRAKAAIPVAGTPLVVRILQWLHAAGVRRAVLNLHHRPETVTRVVGDGSRWGVEVRYSWEREILGSAGGPRRALPLLDAERFLIVNGDTLTTCDLRALAGEHEASGALVTLALVAGDVARYGGAVVEPDGRISGFSRASAPAHRTAPDAPVHRTAPVAPVAPAAPVAPVLHFVGVQAVEARAFRDVPDDVASETVRTLYPRLIVERRGSVRAFVSDAEFLDVGTPRDYLETVARVSAREARPFDRGAGSTVAADALVSETILWDRVTVGAGARLHRCIVTDDVTIPGGAHFEDQVIVAAGDALETTRIV